MCSRILLNILYEFEYTSKLLVINNNFNLTFQTYIKVKIFI